VWIVLGGVGALLIALLIALSLAVWKLSRRPRKALA
jgi:cytochrome oxidase assembly protein ShyY1